MDGCINSVVIGKNNTDHITRPAPIPTTELICILGSINGNSAWCKS
jgi:hypothetical protein